MSVQAVNDAHTKFSFLPYLMRYQFIGFNHSVTNLIGDSVEASPSFMSIDAMPVNVRFAVEYYISGYYGGTINCLEIKSAWGSSHLQKRYFYKHTSYDCVKFDFSVAGRTANGFSPAGRLREWSPMQSTINTSPDFTIQLHNVVVVVKWNMEACFYQNAPQSISLAYGHRHCSGNLPPHIYKRFNPGAAW